MDAQKFGQFIASVRKEHHMTQAELAGKIQVTDKAVSRWERGLGFPDIATIEPLADALGLSVSELMRSERHAQAGVTEAEAAVGVINTIHVAKLQRKRLLKRFCVAVVVVALLIGLWIIGTGLLTRTDVYVAEWTVMPSGDVLTVKVGVAGSMGYIRDCRDVSKDPEVVCLRFYSAFGGLNSNMGARNVFTVPLREGCREVCIVRADGLQTVLRKNEATGMWERVPQDLNTSGDTIVYEE